MAIDRDKVLQAAQKFLEKKKYDKAILEFQKLVAADPSDARTLLKIGDAQAKMGAYAEAVVTYESVGRLYTQQGFALKAIAVYKQIREILSKYIPQLEDRYGHIAPRLAELYTQLGLVSDALAALDEYATRLQNQQRDREAIAIFQKIVELDKQNPLPHLRLAEALSRGGDVEGAVREFGVAANQLVTLGRRDDALKVLERSLHHKNDEEQARLASEIYISRGGQQDGLRALAKLQVCFQANPKHLPTLLLLSRAFNLIGQAQKGIEVQKEMARIARDTNDTAQFREIITRLLLLAPDDDAVKRLAGQAGLGQAGHDPAGGTGGPGAVGAGHAAAVAAAPARPQAGPPPMQRPATPPAAFNAVRGNFVHVPPQPAVGATHTGRSAALDPPGMPTIRAYEGDNHHAEEEDYDEVEPDDLEEAAEPPPSSPYAARGQQSAATQNRGGRDIPAPVETARAVVTQASAARPVAAAKSIGATPAQVDQMLKDATTFRRVRLYEKALALLEEARAAAPSRIELHELERDICLESNRIPEALECMLRVAALYIENLDGESAALALQDVLAYDRRNQHALEMLTELGYEVVDDEDDGQDAAPQEVAPDGNSPSLYESSDARLPSYSYHDDEQAAPGLGRSGRFAQPSPMQLSDPFDVGQEPAHAAGPNAMRAAPAFQQAPHQKPAYDEQPQDNGLPSFPLENDAPLEPAYEAPRIAAATDAPAKRAVHAFSEAPDAASLGESAPPYDAARDQQAVADAAINDADGAAPNTLPPTKYDEPQARSTRSSRGPSGRPNELDLEQALEEIDFFISRGILDDARALLEEQLARSPTNRLLLERWDEIEALAAAGSGERERPGGELYDLDGGSLENFVPQSRREEPQEQVDVEEVFAQFKEGVAKQLGLDDFQAHYDLGIAYKEIGREDDAIREFEVAARDPKRLCVCKFMVSQIELGRSDVDAALTALLAGIRSTHMTTDEEVVMAFDVGELYEKKGNLRDAHHYYQIARRLNPSHRDVEARVKRVSGFAGSARPTPMVADDDFDRALDDIMVK